MNAATESELYAAFAEWVKDHGIVWFDSDTRLAEAVAAALGIDLVWSDRLEFADSKTPLREDEE